MLAREGESEKSSPHPKLPTKRRNQEAHVTAAARKDKNRKHGIVDGRRGSLVEAVAISNLKQAQTSAVCWEEHAYI